MQWRRWIVLALLTAAAPWATAQPAALARIKTGDRLAVELLRHDMRGTELIVGSATAATAEVTATPDGLTLVYSTQRVQKFDGRHTLVEDIFQGRARKVPEEWLFRWLPDDGDFKSVRKVRETSGAIQSCGGKMQSDFEMTPRQALYRLLIAGKETEIPVVEFVFDGRWSATCGTGRQVRKYTYSPDLDLVLSSDYLNYLPNGNFLNAGNGLRVKSIN